MYWNLQVISFAVLVCLTNGMPQSLLAQGNPTTAGNSTTASDPTNATTAPASTAKVATAAKVASVAKEPVWISSIHWLSDAELIATQSQGLLLRPGKIVKASADKPDQLVPLSEADTSLWSVTSAGDLTLAADYKGRILQIKQSTPTFFDFKTRWIRSLSVVPGSTSEVVAGSEDGQVVVFDATGGKEIRRVALESAAVFDIAFNAERTQVAAAMGDGHIHLLNWPNLDRVKSLKGTGANWCVAYSKDGTQLISGGTDRKLRLWDVASGEPIVAIASARDWITSLVTIPGSNFLLAGCMNGELLLANYSTKLPVKTEKVSASGIWDIALSPNGKSLAIGTRKDGIQVLSIEAWIELARQAANAVEADRPPQP